MYQLTPSRELYRDNPWQKPYEMRIDNLRRARKYRQRTAVFLYPRFDSSTFRYRGYNISETLDFSIAWKAACFEIEEIDRLIEDMDLVDVLVLIRCAWTRQIENFVQCVKEKGIRLCYDVDDLIYDPKYMRDIMEALGLDNDFEFNFWSGLTQKNSMIIGQCDAMLTTNEYLAGYMRADLLKPCYIIPNYLNWIQENVSCEYFEAKREQKSGRPFALGYFSGSPTHARDFMVAMPEVEEFLNRHEDSVLRIVGYMDLPEEYHYLADSGRIVSIPFQSFVGLQYEQAIVDVNIVPLVNNTFSNCKSELKYFESAIVGTITCATPSFAYARAIQSGENGYLCEQGEWLPVFEKIYAEGVSAEKMAEIQTRALGQYSYKNMIRLVEQTFDHVMKE